MTVAWDSVKAAVVEFIASTKVVANEHVFWEREAAPIAYEDLIELRISSERAVGFDDLELVETGDKLVPHITGWREFTLSIRFFSRSQATAARYALEKVRASFHHPARVALLAERGVSFLTTETLQTLDAVSDARWESIGVLDVRLGVVSDLYEPETDEGVEPLVDVAVNGTVYPLVE